LFQLPWVSGPLLPREAEKHPGDTG
jgi:hypothetical protein